MRVSDNITDWDYTNETPQQDETYTAWHSQHRRQFLQL